MAYTVLNEDLNLALKPARSPEHSVAFEVWTIVKSGELSACGNMQPLLIEKARAPDFLAILRFSIRVIARLAATRNSDFQLTSNKTLS